jgi:hypothetical protein
MNESTSIARRSLAPESRPSGENDAAFVELWLGTKVSAHTRRAYRGEIERFRRAVDKPLAWVAMADLQAYAERLGQGSLKPASSNRALTAIRGCLKSPASSVTNGASVSYWKL